MSSLVNEPKAKRGRHEGEDKFSYLPDCLLLHIFSFLSAKQVVQTSVLSTRWKYIWKGIPTLILHDYNFSTSKSFDKFVSEILRLRDGSIALHTFDFSRSGSSTHVLKRIANYVSSHSVNLQQLGLTFKGDSSLIMPCISSCLALTSLKLSLYHKSRYSSEKTLFPKSLNLPALTTLDLTNFAFCTTDNAGSAEPFSAFNNLKSLIIYNCVVQNAQILNISSATLVNLTIDTHIYKLPKIQLSAPSLSTFTFTGVPNVKLCQSTLSSIKQLNIDIFMSTPTGEQPLVLLSWLIDLPSIKSLKVTSSTLLVLCLVPDLLKRKFTSLCNLNSLKVEMKPLSYRDSGFLDVMLKNKSRYEASKIKNSFNAGLEPCATILDRIVGFLLQNSPLANVDITGYKSVHTNFCKMQCYILGFLNDATSNEDTVEKSQCRLCLQIIGREECSLMIFSKPFFWFWFGSLRESFFVSRCVYKFWFGNHMIFATTLFSDPNNLSFFS